MKILNSRGYIVIHLDYFNQYLKNYYDMLFIRLGFSKELWKLDQFLNNVNLSSIKSQYGQDLFALLSVDFKSEGYFVEVGAYDGVTYSNTYLLEQIGWQGLLIEPSKHYNKIKKNRAVKSYNCAVYSNSNVKLEFIDSKEFSTLMPFRISDNHNRSGKIYFVNTMTLEELLIDSNAPNYIDFISIDTEGSEFEILKSFNFVRYTFGVISIEHNFVQEKRNKIHQLLTSFNYIRVLEGKTEVDDWYVNNQIFRKNPNLFK